MQRSAQDFYASHSELSQPGECAALLRDAPADLSALCALVRKLVLHQIFARRLDPPPPPESETDAESRTIPAMLARVVARQDGPLAAPRAPQQRLIGSCRDYALLLATLLREQGRPARLRVGFADYFEPGFFADHWVCELWDSAEERWRLIDAELGADQIREFAIDFDPTDVPRDRFLVSGTAWPMCRSGDVEPERFGVLGIDIRGLWFAAGNLLRDLAALNKVEMLPWDYWGPAVDFSSKGEVEAAALPWLDGLAELTAAADPALDRLRALYLESAGLEVPDRILSYPNGRETRLDWRQALSRSFCGS